jgi:hypothetical protein
MPYADRNRQLEAQRRWHANHPRVEMRAERRKGRFMAHERFDDALRPLLTLRPPAELSPLALEAYKAELSRLIARASATYSPIYAAADLATPSAASPAPVPAKLEEA